jgi:hypothetical protein
VLICSRFGLIAVCVGVAAYRLVALVISQYILGTRMLGIPLRRTIVEDPGPAFVSSLALLAFAFPAVQLLQEAGAPRALTLLVAAGGFGTYLVALRFLFQAAWQDTTMVAAAMVPTRITKRLRHVLRPSTS